MWSLCTVKRMTLKAWAIGATGLLVLFGLLVFIMEQLDNRRPSVVQPPDKVTSFVETLELADLVASATPPDVELKLVTQGSGGGTGQFKHERDPSVYRGALLEGATSRKHIEFEMTCDPELRASLLLRLRDAMQKSLSRWNPNVQVSEAASPDGLAKAEGFVLEYRAEGQAGDYDGEIRVAIKEVPKELMRPSETGKVIHSLSIASSEERWAHE
jgi:hypothetical protein